jgi:ubiquinone/menaquinone biosynthesis C-methylase UbiE
MKINLGCGKNKIKGYINIDKSKESRPDVICDLNCNFPFKDNAIDEIIAIQLLEHLNNIIKTMEEIWRISKNNCLVRIDVPYYNCKGAFADPSHHSFFTDSTFNYFTGENIFYHYSNINFEIKKMEFVPLNFLKWFPKGLLLKISHFISNLIIEMRVELKVKKHENSMDF